jgi:hypothetical protein
METQSPGLKQFQLIPFEPLPQGFHLKVEGHISRPNPETLQIHYQLTGNLDAIRLPQRANPPVRRDELWTTTCLELFIGRKGLPAYWELNLSPNGDWNIYKLTDYRNNLTPELEFQDLASVVHHAAEHFELHLVCPLPTDLKRSSKLEVAICAVIQPKQGPISYWALNHGGTEADFHRRDDFVLSL